MRKYYISIGELPVKRWQDIYKSKSLKPLLKFGRLDKYALKVYEGMQDELIREFGVGDDFQRIMELKVRNALLRSKIALTGDRTHQIFIDKNEELLKEIEDKQVPVDLFKTVIRIEKEQGYKLNMNDLTVREFYQYADFIKNNR